jgi:deoxycytidylate deaminase
MSCDIPCKDCLIEIINAGIEEIIVTGMTSYDTMAPYLLKVSKIKVRTYDL